MKYLCKTEGLPKTVKVEQIMINDIVSYKVKDRPIFSRVIDITPTMLKVKNFETDITEKGVYFLETDNIDPVTKNYVSKTRKVLKLCNLIYF